MGPRGRKLPQTQRGAISARNQDGAEGVGETGKGDGEYRADGRG